MRTVVVRCVVMVGWMIFAKMMGAPEWTAFMFAALMDYLAVPERAK